MVNWIAKIDSMITDKVNRVCDAAIDKALNGVSIVLLKAIKGVVYIVLQYDDLFVAVAIIGVFIMMFGNRKLGTKVTSLSIIIYAVLRVVFSTCN